MKKFFIPVLIVFLIWSCQKNQINNPYLQRVSFDVRINLDLPQYQSLNYPGSAIYIGLGGIKGIFVYNSGYGYNAFEASDPNHYPNDCSTMELNGMEVTCPCENNRYSLSDGHLMAGQGSYGLLPYHVSKEGNILHIYN